MTQHNEICATTCCGERGDPPVVNVACSPCCNSLTTNKKFGKKDIKCYEEQLISLPKLHDIYCKQEKNKESVTLVNKGKPKINVRNEIRLKQKEEDVYFVFRQMLQLYKAEEVMFAFNGGKDCTVVLDMLNRFYGMVCFRNVDIPVLYVYSDDSFSEVNEFVDQCAKRYKINLFKYNGDMKEGLGRMLKERDFRDIKACVMGLRSSDPYCNNLKIMQFTDPDWPPLMRINPILEWTYGDVWNYLLYYEVPYCPLYDQGYTSLGSRSNTVRNDLLKCNQPICKEAYFPAYELLDSSTERAGRVSLSAGGFKNPIHETNFEQNS